MEPHCSVCLGLGLDEFLVTSACMGFAFCKAIFVTTVGEQLLRECIQIESQSLSSHMA